MAVPITNRVEPFVVADTRRIAAEKRALASGDELHQELAVLDPFLGIHPNRRQLVADGGAVRSRRGLAMLRRSQSESMCATGG